MFSSEASTADNYARNSMLRIAKKGDWGRKNIYIKRLIPTGEVFYFFSPNGLVIYSEWINKKKK